MNCGRCSELQSTVHWWLRVHLCCPWRYGDSPEAALVSPRKGFCCLNTGVCYDLRCLVVHLLVFISPPEEGGGKGGKPVAILTQVLQQWAVGIGAGGGACSRLARSSLRPHHGWLVEAAPGPSRFRCGTQRAMAKASAQSMGWIVFSDLCHFLQIPPAGFSRSLSFLWGSLISRIILWLLR